MKNCMHLFLTCLLLGLFSNQAKTQVAQGFETSSCGNVSNPFFTGCFPGWISTCGSADIQSSFSGISPYEGSRYVHMYSNWEGFDCGNNATASRTEGIALNYSFQANQTYILTFAMRWQRSTYCNSFNAKWILTNGKVNQTGSWQNCNNDGGVTPAISGSDQVIQTYNLGSTSSAWNTYTITFTPTSNYSQLWLRNETLPNPSCSPFGEYSSSLYLDDFKLVNCSAAAYSTNFYLAASSNFNGNVSVSTSAYSNPLPVNHWWDVFYAPNGSTSGNSEVPGNPTQIFVTSAFFNANMYVNQWYYIKHGIWNDCISWRETRKRFRVQVYYALTGEPRYELEVEDIDFEPTEKYLSMMDEIARNNELETSFEAINVEPLDIEIDKINTQLRSFPNPFSEQTTLEFSLEKEASVSLYVSDMTGKQIAVLMNEENTSQGTHQVAFDGSALSSGIYYYTIKAGDYLETKKMILIK